MNDDSHNKGKAKSASFLNRNIMKSILRQMKAHIKNERDPVVNILKMAGYKMTEIEHAFFTLNSFDAADSKSKARNELKKFLEKAIKRKSAYTYILRDALHDTMKEWEDGKYGKISKTNFEEYKKTYECYYAKAKNLLTSHRSGSNPK